MVKALEYFHVKEEFKNISPDLFYRFGSKDDIEKNVCGTNIENELCDSKLNNYLKGLVSSRDIDKATISKIRVGIFDSDTNTKVINDSTLGIYSFKIEPANISTEFLFLDSEIKSEVEGKRLFIGDEFDSRTKRNSTNTDLTLGGGSANTNKAGKRVIIDTDVYNPSSVNIALSKDFFAQAVYNEELEISETSWEAFRHIFEKINEIILS